MSNIIRDIIREEIVKEMRTPAFRRYLSALIKKELGKSCPNMHAKNDFNEKELAIKELSDELKKTLDKTFTSSKPLNHESIKINGKTFPKFEEPNYNPLGIKFYQVTGGIDKGIRNGIVGVINESTMDTYFKKGGTQKGFDDLLELILNQYNEPIHQVKVDKLVASLKPGECIIGGFDRPVRGGKKPLKESFTKDSNDINVDELIDIVTQALGIDKNDMDIKVFDMSKLLNEDDDNE